ncbi:MAG: ROK family protein [Bacteroidota bacterium]
MNRIVLGVDIGGSHITAALIDLVQKIEIKESWSRNRIDANASASEIINAWANTIENSMGLRAMLPSKINIAMPGPMNYKKGICKIKSQDKYNALYNLNIKAKLAERLDFDSKKINFINDAACFLKGEVFNGSLSGIDDAIGLTLGTGLGTSYYAKGKATDANLWKMPFMKGIAEDYISTRWFVKRFAELSGIVIKDVKELVEHHPGNPHFKQVFKEFSENLAGFLYKFIRKGMPLAAVIGGNIANAEAYFLHETREYLAEMMGYSFPVKRSGLGESATLMGAGSSY